MYRFFLALLFAIALIGNATAKESASGLKSSPFGSDVTIADVDNLDWQLLKVKGMPERAEIALVRGDLSKGNAEFFLRFPAGYKVPNHNHTSDETYVWVAGAFTLVAQDGSRTNFNGPAFVSFPGNAPPHGLECSKAAECVVYIKLSRPFDINYFPEPATQ